MFSISTRAVVGGWREEKRKKSIKHSHSLTLYVRILYSVPMSKIAFKPTCVCPSPSNRREYVFHLQVNVSLSFTFKSRSTTLLTLISVQTSFYDIASTSIELSVDLCLCLVQQSLSGKCPNLKTPKLALHPAIELSQLLTRTGTHVKNAGRSGRR